MYAGSRLNVIKGRISTCLVYMCQNFVNVKGQVTEDCWEILFTVCNN